MTRLDQQMAFLNEADRLKSVTRANNLTDQSRAENSAEHSWHAALAAMIWLHDQPDALVSRVLRKLILHDLVEIDAGDQPVHIEHDAKALAQAESRAADRLFGLLPDDQHRDFHATWHRFENHALPQAKAVDYAIPVLMVIKGSDAPEWHRDVARHTLTEGRGTSHYH